MLFKSGMALVGSGGDDHERAENLPSITAAETPEQRNYPHGNQVGIGLG